jgi:hypothetical protein
MKTIMTKYHEATNTRESNVSATDGCGNRASVPYEPYQTHDEAHDAAALKLCRKLGLKGKLLRGWYGRCNTYTAHWGLYTPSLREPNVLEIPE